MSRTLAEDRLNVYAAEKDGHLVVGGVRSLKALRGALKDASYSGEGKVKLFATDGEGYDLEVKQGPKGMGLQLEGQSWPHQPVAIQGSKEVLKGLAAAVDDAITKGKSESSGCLIFRDDSPSSNLAYPYQDKVFRIPGKKDPFSVYR